jgi:hypothetical protein
MPAGGLLIGSAIGLGEFAYGEIQKHKYLKQQAALAANRPTYAAAPEEQQSENLALSQANKGMSAASRQALTNNTDRTLGTLANATLMSGGNQNTVANIAGNVQNSYDQNALYDDRIRLQNLDNLQNSFARASAVHDKGYQLNQLQPWQNNMAAVNQQLNGANSVINSGFNTAASGFAQAVKGLGSSSGGNSSPGNFDYGLGGNYGGNINSGAGGLGAGNLGGGGNTGLGQGIGIAPLGGFTYFGG